MNIFNVQTATRFKSRMLIGLMSVFMRQACGNLTKLCINSTATGQLSQCFLIILFITRIFQPSHNTKRKAKAFSALKRLKNTAGRRESGKDVVDPVFAFMNSQLTSLPMCGFIAQLVEHRTGIAEVTGSNPVEALIFFRLLYSNCLNWKFTAKITYHLHRDILLHEARLKNRSLRK